MEEKGGMKLSFADWLVILVFGLASFFHFRGFDPAEGKMMGGNFVADAHSFSSSLTLGAGERRRMLLFILDFRDFSCMVCLESFLELYRRIPPQVVMQDCWGIVIIPPDQEKDEACIGIAEKKLKGFIRAHQILSPFLVDRNMVFGKMTEGGSGVVLLDERSQEVVRCDFPLRGGEFQRILEALAE